MYESLPAHIRILSFDERDILIECVSGAEWPTNDAHTELNQLLTALTRVLAGKGLSGMKPLSASKSLISQRPIDHFRQVFKTSWV